MKWLLEMTISTRNLTNEYINRAGGVLIDIDLGCVNALDYIRH